jgi:hypothetical protein
MLQNIGLKTYKDENTWGDIDVDTNIISRGCYGTEKYHMKI